MLTVVLLSAPKLPALEFIFRTLTPVDFSVDNKKLIIKEKVGHRHDGIWKTDLWIYDFEAATPKRLPQIREAIIDYWAQVGGMWTGKKEDVTDEVIAAVYEWFIGNMEDDMEEYSITYPSTDFELVMRRKKKE